MLSAPTVRLVDIEKEILKGGIVKPGILDDEITPGPSKRPKLKTQGSDAATSLPPPPPLQPAVVFRPTVPVQTLVPVRTTTPTTYILNSVPVGNLANQGTSVLVGNTMQQAAPLGFGNLPNSMIIGSVITQANSLPAGNVLQQTNTVPIAAVIQQTNATTAENTVQKTETNNFQCVVAKKPIPALHNNKPPILRRTAPQLVTQNIPVERMWSEIKNGVRFLHPSNLDHDILNKVADTLKTKSSLKNTIISLPNSVYLVPVGCFKGAPLPPDSMVSIANGTNAEQQKEESQIPVKLKHPCWNTKRNRKIDLDGFSAYDRLGFYKAESARAKKCQRHIDTIIDCLQKSVEKLRKELSVLNPEQSRMTRQKQKFQTVHQPKMTIKRQSKVKRYVAGVPQLRSRKTSFECMSAKMLASIKNSSPPIIDHTNFERFQHHETSVFVNRDSTVTEMILESFPNFREAVKNHVVKIANEPEFNSVFGLDWIKEECEVVQDVGKHVNFVKYLKDKHLLSDVLNEHSYACLEDTN